METMIEEDISKAFDLFIEETVKQFIELGSVIEIKSKKLTLILDHKEIKDKKDLKTSNGKYYLNEKYKDCYYPFSDSAGVYLFFNEDKEAIYVGKSEKKVGRQIWSHTGPYKNGEYADLEFKDAEYVIVIPFIKAPFMAPSFESYLLNNYEFKYNKRNC